MSKKLMIITSIILTLAFIGILSVMFSLMMTKQDDNKSKIVSSITSTSNDISKFEGMVVSTSELIDLINSEGFSKCDNIYDDNVIAIIVYSNGYHYFGNARELSKASWEAYCYPFLNSQGYDMDFSAIGYDDTYIKVSQSYYSKLYNSKQYKLNVIVRSHKYDPGNTEIYGIYAEAVD